MNDPLRDADPEQLREVFTKTEIRRSPITGIVEGYHTLPFTLVGPNDESDEYTENPGALKLTGKITVGPKLVMTLGSQDEIFSEIFPEELPFMDRRLVGRMFSFNAGYRRNHRIRNEFLHVEKMVGSDQEVLAKVLNELERAEIINMGVIWCPEPRFYPISIERFIVSVLDRELK